ncbi:AEC family transporter [Vallitalea guaymasensis]|uniref:AEC family transporter n=1 Tax=Vallitalea guaymasensis TaxID=1185412 RepID=A0A8J8SDV1_9FIRM|nr:AEC family transporter [Vallitalea guaymasensis]QUH30895.1 AEC family transporter [Vallitalea guaymasensis]
MELISKVMPILILFLIGFLIRKTNFLSKETIDGIKKIVIDMALPAVLFIAFVNIELKKEYVGLIFSIILLCSIMLCIGFLLTKIPKISNPVLPFVLCGFTFGLLGIPLYITVFGETNLPSMAIMGVGHEFFLWIIYMSAVKLVFSNEKLSLKTLKGFLTSPLIIALVLGITVNVLGLSNLLHEQPVLNGLYVTLEYFSEIATPLILIVIGYGLSFDKEFTKYTIIYVIMRYAIMLTVGYLIKFLIIDRFMTFDKYLEYAYFTLLILPPPFSLSIFVARYGDEKNAKLVNNITVATTCVCVITYIVYVFIAI